MAMVDSVRGALQEQSQAAARRYQDTSTQRSAVTQQLDEGVKFPDSREAIAARARRLLDRGAVPPAAVVTAASRTTSDTESVYERVIGASMDLQAWSFLPRGVRAAGTVARITVRDQGRELPLGTGFLVSPRLLMTNHHVLPDEAFAAQCFVEFNAQVTIDNTPDQPVRLDLDPRAFFVADERLDFALVQIAPGADGIPPGERFGWNKLSIQLGTLVIGEPANVIGHPMGHLKEIAIRNNALQLRLDDFLHYGTDTQPGNSGSPVFNDQWEVAALHHCGVPASDEQGRLLRKDGRLWQPGDGDDALAYVANEGVRISSILRHLTALPLDPAQRTVLAQMGPESRLLETAATQPPAPTATVPASVITAPGVAERTGGHTGLRASTEAFGEGRHLVFLHGRSQQGKDPEMLRRQWCAGLNAGLTRAGDTPIVPANVWFPFYGDVLAEAMGPHTAAPRSPEAAAAGPVEAFPPTPTGTYEQLVSEAADKAAMPPDGHMADEGLGDVLTSALQRQLSWLAARTDLDEWVIAATLRDVAAYLDQADVRDAVLDCVLETMPASGELVLVSHSLGTVVAMDLLTRLAPELGLTLIVTAGSPLGLDTVFNRLLTRGPHRPPRVRQWLNAWCPTDAVATGCPLAAVWGHDALTDVAVTNARGRAHSIDEYLAHAEAAAPIGQVIRTA
ncbi:trypsin-like peptidase domain-containing protein [Streptomyces sp. NPDC005784]|uniref:trypsin-like peptidase domain-containing protein n=1 Tax=Streptomyces sp. NPDC005784 TaxID=3364731 RepID=UPI00368F126B